MMDPDLAGCTLLIVDDEPVNLALLSDTLRTHYRVRAANCGERALRAAHSEPHPDLILLDIMMPGMDGYKVLSRLQEDPVTRDIPVIFITALAEDSDEERGLIMGAVDYITKPFKPAVVLARVRLHLELKYRRDQLKHQNQWLETEVAQRLEDNLLIQDVSLCALAELVETRDSDTGNHILRTQAYVEVLGHQLRRSAHYRSLLDERSLNCIIKAAPLHDIGKIGIPDQILLKPGALTDSEFAVMMTHSRIGADSIAQAMEKAQRLHPPRNATSAQQAMAFLEEARVIALYHHERWNGEGYPEKLTGAAIPLSARLMAVADVYDAITNRRIYKPAMHQDKAADFILAEAGGYFDPDVVEAFAGARNEFEQVARRFSASAPSKGSSSDMGES